MKLGVVGLPNVGKSTIFNALTSNKAESANYPFCTIEPNVGIVAVPDERLDVLTKMYNSKRTVPASIEFVDIAGIVKGASQGEGLGNKFLSHIRETDAIIHVVRCFQDSTIIHVEGDVNPIRDIETINLELILADLESVNKRLDKASKQAKTGTKDAVKEYNLLLAIKAELEKEKPARSCKFTADEYELAKTFFLLTTKPTIYCANIAEGDISNPSNNPHFVAVAKKAEQEDNTVIAVSGKIEEEIAQAPENEKNELRELYCIKDSGLNQLIKASYNLLGLISFLTAGEQETRAWTIIKGTKAPQAAGKIHTDFERGFIKAEIVAYADLISAGSMLKAKELGKVRSEGKEYVMKDGDVTLFRFNV
ncbi:obg gtpase family [Holotrichia oblita]|nr:obg gtpase family [Holotrichia oblita]